MNITLKSSWIDAARTLGDPFAFILAIRDYIQTGEEPEVAPDASGMFAIVKADIDAQAKNRQRVQKCRQKQTETLPKHYSNATETLPKHYSNVTEIEERNTPIPPKKEIKKSSTNVLPKESEPLSFVGMIPASLKTVEFEIAWDQWCKYRREIKHSITKSTAERQLSKLGRYPPAVAIAAIDESIEKGWTGLFPERVTITLPAVRKTRDHTGI
jgi:hypothetical protein